MAKHEIKAAGKTPKEHTWFVLEKKGDEWEPIRDPNKHYSIITFSDKTAMFTYVQNCPTYKEGYAKSTLMHVAVPISNVEGLSNLRLVKYLQERSSFYLSCLKDECLPKTSMDYIKSCVIFKQD